MSDDFEVARSLLMKVWTFVSTQLSDQESRMFATLLAPGVLSAYADGGDEVTGFGVSSAGTPAGPEVDWRPSALADALG